MSTFPYINPQSPNRVLGPSSTYLNRSFGTNFSTLSVGGYMEVFSLDQLYYTIPSNTYGQINYSGNSIPINFFKGSGTTFSFDTITLNSDKISSGRRKLGMLVYVYEEKQIYQFTIDNYETLWNNALTSSGIGGPTVVVSNFGVTVKGNSPEGIAFISAWTANTVQEVSGETEFTAVWKKIPDIYVTGSTLIPATDNTDFQSSVLSYHGIPIPGTYSIDTENTFTTGASFNIVNGVISYFRNDGFIYSIDLSTIDINGTYITGGTLDLPTLSTNNGLINLLYNQFIPPGTYSLPYTDTFITGLTYNDNNVITIKDNSGNTFNSTFNTVTGLTVNGNLTVTGQTNLNNLTITGTGLYNHVATGSSLDEIVNFETLTSYTQTNDVYVTGNTYTAATNNTNNATIGLLYHSTPLGGPHVLNINDTFITGFTYNNSNVFTIKDNSGNTFNANISVMSGLSINGNLSITGNTTQLGNYTLTGNSTQFGVYTHSGNTFMTGNTSQVGNYNTTGNTTQFGNVYLSGTSLSGQCALFIDGNVCIDGDLTVTGDTSLIGDVCIKNANSGNLPTGTACLGTNLIPTSGTTYHEFQNKSGTLAHLGDLTTGDENSKGYIYMENNLSGTTLPSVSIGGQAQYQKISGVTTTISAYNNFFTTGSSSNELLYTYTAATGGTLTYLKYNISYTASITAAQNKQITFQLFKNPFPYTGGTGTTVNGCSSCQPVPAAMTNYIQGNNAATGTLTGIVTAQYLDKFTLYAVHSTNINVPTTLTVSDLTISLFT